MNAKPVVLVVDDDAHDAALITRAFRQSGLDHTVHVVTNAVDALKYLQGDGPYNDRLKFPPPDLVTLDSRIPESGDWEVLLWVRQQPELGKLPVVIFCGSGSPADEKLALDLGANAYHLKPQDFDEFVQTVGRIGRKWLPAE
jgi:CheY-like chemotaxis protein